MTAREQLAQFAAGSKALPRLCREYKKERATVPVSYTHLTLPTKA